MNSREKQMLEILKKLKEDFGVVSVKAEFEAEGTRIDELLRLVEISHKSSLNLTVKIGGCEAIRDLYEAKQIGVDYIVAPMVESAYAASKFVDAKNMVFSSDEQNTMEFLTNLETVQGFMNLNEILSCISGPNGLTGLVFGRVDFVGSKGIERKEVDSEIVLNDVLTVAESVKNSGLKIVVGGGVSSDSIDFLREVSKTHLSRYETRKIVFDGASINFKNISKGLLSAVHFELLWLLNKQEYYGKIHLEDQKRIDMLENRWKILNAK